MRGLVVVVVAVLALRQCSSRSLDEDSVVSVYTTQATTAGTPGRDVYHQIADNIAERITVPIFRFLGINRTTTEEKATSAKKGSSLELLDDPEFAAKPLKPVDNDISKDRDVEELSIEAQTRVNDKKPEKIVLYTSYLPTANVKMENESTTEPFDFDSDFDLDDVGSTTRETGGPFVYILELLGSLVQFAWGAFEAIFRPSSNRDDKNE